MKASLACGGSGARVSAWEVGYVTHSRWPLNSRPTLPQFVPGRAGVIFLLLCMRLSPCFPYGKRGGGWGEVTGMYLFAVILEVVMIELGS